MQTDGLGDIDDLGLSDDPDMGKVVHLKNHLDPSNDASNITDEQQAEIDVALAILRDPKADFNARLDSVIALQTQVIPRLFREANAKYPSIDRSICGARAIVGLRDVSKLMLERKASDAAEELNPHSPKFLLAIGWLIETFHLSMTEQDLDPIAINNVFNSLASKLVGWEDQVAKKLRGVSAKALEGVKNPFVEEFFDKTKIQ